MLHCSLVVSHCVGHLLCSKMAVNCDIDGLFYWLLAALTSINYMTLFMPGCFGLRFQVNCDMMII